MKTLTFILLGGLVAALGGGCATHNAAGVAPFTPLYGTVYTPVVPSYSVPSYSPPVMHYYGSGISGIQASLMNHMR